METATIGNLGEHIVNPVGLGLVPSCERKSNGDEGQVKERSRRRMGGRVKGEVEKEKKKSKISVSERSK